MQQNWDTHSHNTITQSTVKVKQIEEMDAESGHSKHKVWLLKQRIPQQGESFEGPECWYGRGGPLLLPVLSPKMSYQSFTRNYKKYEFIISLNDDDDVSAYEDNYLSMRVRLLRVARLDRRKTLSRH